MKIHDLTKEKGFLSLVTSEDGLSEEEAKRRLAEFGYNEIEEIKKKTAYLQILKPAYTFSCYSALGGSAVFFPVRIHSSR